MIELFGIRKSSIIRTFYIFKKFEWSNFAIELTIELFRTKKVRSLDEVCCPACTEILHDTARFWCFTGNALTFLFFGVMGSYFQTLRVWCWNARIWGLSFCIFLRSKIFKNFKLDLFSKKWEKRRIFLGFSSKNTYISGIFSKKTNFPPNPNRCNFVSSQYFYFGFVLKWSYSIWNVHFRGLWDWWYHQNTS